MSDELEEFYNGYQEENRLHKDNVSKIEIINLADEQGYLEEVSRWIWEEWDNEGKKHTLDEVIYRSKHSICKDRIPMMFIAKYDGQLAGVMSLWNNDLKSRQDLTPYAGTFFVKKEFRGRGVDKALIRNAFEVTKSLGYEYLYFWSHHKNYYERMKGVEYMEEAPLDFGEYVTLYRIKLT